jgi:phosphopantothenoylcysteine decarboxylase/phosphopantothenate--cysteine ligase
MPSPLASRRILLVISGGIAAYKSLDLIRRLKDEGASVRCILTEGGAQFITPLSVSTLSGESCFTELFSKEEEERLGHIRLSRESDLIVVAPATANMIAKMAHGLADNLASAVLLASDKPVMIAPAMNSMMWQHPATQANIETLRNRGILQAGPAAGYLACGEEGAGRLADIDTLMEAIRNALARDRLLAGKKVLVTSGPTFEPLDPVRFIGNRSSGKQGLAIAEALARRGADVTLVSGPTALPCPAGVTLIKVETAQEMLDSCLAVTSPDIAICAAAVADWRPETAAQDKLKKDGATPALRLVENPDILATLSKPSQQRPKLVIGFAAETDNVIDNAKAKFARKGCDWLLANQVGKDKAFGQDINQVTLFKRKADGTLVHEAWQEMSKRDIAETLADHIASHLKG